MCVWNQDRSAAKPTRTSVHQLLDIDAGGGRDPLSEGSFTASENSGSETSGTVHKQRSARKRKIQILESEEQEDMVTPIKGSSPENLKGEIGTTWELLAITS